MQILKCKACGANLEITNQSHIYECPYCGTKQLISTEKVMDHNDLEEFEIQAGTLIKYNGEADVVSIPKKVKSIGKKAFYGMTVCEVVIPETVVSIQESAFEKCRHLKKVNVPKSVQEIEYLAFRDCTSLKKVVIENGNAKISSSAFVGCKKDIFLVKIVEKENVAMKPKSTFAYWIDVLIAYIIVFGIVVGVIRILVFFSNLF